ncbi:DUF2975 domain-containing protein [Protaetiibacter sp. SSC-01]|uniref:DUF2975 domain-containing protein n=1 Tax=Protaetiibacter sp. SSC-01 TaxID=2759943 RepID=UPI001656D9B6|nr:DUF2975 domain-containing protein [Protaetiibacter sp. SSC-01]QNO37308.1 DUF2975 domain-containing protein [Protaetiibacter sp. SSC-01]
MSRLAVLALRILLVLLALGMLVAQLVPIPVGALEFGDAFGSRAVGVFYAVAAIALVACAQVVLVAVWVLLSMVRRGSIFSGRAFRWVDVIIGAGVGAVVASSAIAGHLYLVVEPRLDAPGIIVLAGTVVLATAAFAALMVVMRRLLRSATELQGELAEVV